MLFDELEDWLSYLESLHPNTIDLGLERVQQVASRLHLNFSNISVFTVAGTNGKGSCVATVEALLKASGEQVGAYTSPHLLRYNERVRIDGREASDAELCVAFDAVEKVRGDISLTYFEFGTLAALILFIQAKVSAVVLEVGLGGRLDAVNIVDPDIAIITSIDIDHQDWLGDNREDIGREKAGIYRRNTPALCADLDPPQSVIKAAQSLSASLSLAKRDFFWNKNRDDSWSWRGRTQSGAEKIIELPATPLPLASISAAIQAFYIWGGKLSEEQIRHTVAETRLVGRCQKVSFYGKQIILDVAHNPAAANYLKERLGRRMENGGDCGAAGQLIAVFGAMADKDITVMLTILRQVVDRWVFCGLPHVPRAVSVDKLKQIAADLGLNYSAWDTAKKGFEFALESAQASDRILVLGSFYTIAEVLNYMQARQ